MIVSPTPDVRIPGPAVSIEGWAWSNEGVTGIEISEDDGQTWVESEVQERADFSWQKFHVKLELDQGPHTILARAVSSDGRTQPLGEGRNHVHRVTVEVI